MKFQQAILTAATAICLTLPAFAADGWDRASDYNKQFNSRSIVTMSGTVTKVDREAHPMKGMQAGLVATLKSDSGEITEVQVGPTWFTKFYHPKWNIQTGDRIKVTGSRVTIDGHPALMVVVGEKGSLKLTVRNRQGSPIWDFPVEGF